MHTFRSRAGSERHARIDRDNPLLRIPISHIRELRSAHPNRRQMNGHLNVWTLIDKCISFFKHERTHGCFYA